MDFYKASQLAKGRDASLLIDYTEFREAVLAHIQNKSLSGVDVFLEVKKQWRTRGMIYLFLCLAEKENTKEFTELFYEISLTFYSKSSHDPTQRCVDICCLYIFYHMQGIENTPIGLNSLVMKHVLDNQSSELEVTKDLIKLLIDKSAFMLSYLAGLKTRVINRRGEVLKLMASDSEGNQLMSKAEKHFMGSEDLLALKKLKTKYLETKRFLLKEFVTNDTNELLDFDEDTGLVSRKLQEDLSKVTSLSLDIERLQAHPG
jgi:hypothetical protein